MRRVIMFLSFLGIFISAYGMDLSIQTERSSFLPFQPIYLQINYAGDEDLILSPDYRQTELTVYCQTTEKERIYTPSLHFDYTVEENQKQGFEKSDVVKITTDLNGCLFESPGVYSVVLKVPEKNWISNTITITIDLPMTYEDIKAFEAIKACPEYGEFVSLEGGDMFPKALILAQSLATGSSAYREDARELLVKNYCQRLYTADRKWREPDLDKAMEYLTPTVALKNGRHLNRFTSMALVGRLVKTNNPGSLKRNQALNELADFKRLHRGRGLEKSSLFLQYLN